MPTQIKKIGLANGIKPTGKKFNLSDLIQESYKVSYVAKKINNKKLIELTESHLINIKKDPTNTKELSEDLDVLQGLTKLGKDQELKDLEEVDTTSKKRSKKKCVNSCVKPMDPVKESWKSSRDRMDKALKGFRESAKNKVFYKELDRFNKSISKKNPITMSESVNLYKACNSCLTHLTVELEKNPSFRKSYRECTKMLSNDNLKLLESIQNNKLPSKSLLENFVTFTNILLESNTPEELDPEIYEDADIETLDDRDVINEDADMETLDDRDVIDEDADMETLDDRDVINEDEEISDDSVSVDLTPEEISILKSVLGKISSMQETEDPELVPDETSAPEMTSDNEEIDEEDDIEDEEDVEDEDSNIDDIDEEDDVEDETPEDSSDLDEDEDGEGEGTSDSVENSLENIKDQIDDVIDNIKGDNLQEEDDTDNEEDNELDFELSENAVKRIKKCF